MRQSIEKKHRIVFEPLFLIRVTLVALLLIVVVGLGGCSKAPLKVGVIAKLETGSVMGMSTWDQVKFFEQNHKGAPLEFVPFSDDGTQAGIEAIYESARAQGIEIMITAHKSDSAVWMMDKARAMAEAGDSAMTLNLAAGSTTELLTGLDDGFLRFVQGAKQEQLAIVKYIEQNQYKKVLVIRDTDNKTYGNTALDAFESTYQLPYKLVDVSISALDFEEMERSFRADDYDFVYLIIGDYNINSGAIAQLAHLVKPDAKIMYNAWMKTQALFQTAGDSISGSAMLSHYPPRGQNEAIDTYLNQYQTTFNYFPNTIGLTVYKIIDVLNQAANKGLRRPEDIKAFILETEGLTTLLGPVNLDAFGDTSADFYYIEDIMGEFK